MGIQFADNGGRLQVVLPRGLVLSAERQAAICQRKDDILARLHSGGITGEDVVATFPGAVLVATGPLPADEQARRAACRLLCQQLDGGPRRLVAVQLAWTGVRRVLREAMWILKVVTFVGEDKRLWLRLPTEREEEQPAALVLPDHEAPRQHAQQRLTQQ